MRIGHRPSRRGAALLIVLATLILAAGASVTIAVAASTQRLTRELARRTLIADDLLRAAESPILAWVEAESQEVVLPPDSAVPQVEILHDVFTAGETRYELHITAWDQCGMVPVGAARSGSPLRLALPPDVRQCLDRLTIPEGVAPGLDLFLAVMEPGGVVSVFPMPVDTELLRFAASGDEIPPDPAPASAHGSPEAAWQQLAIGSLAATHNPGLINVNTAPAELLEAALRSAGRGGLEQILAARAEGRLAPTAGGPQAGVALRGSPQPVATSTSWAMRIDVAVGALHRSWWAVYTKSASTQWECVQRLAIPE